MILLYETARQAALFTFRARRQPRQDRPANAKRKPNPSIGIDNPAPSSYRPPRAWVMRPLSVSSPARALHCLLYRGETMRSWLFGSLIVAFVCCVGCLEMEVEKLFDERVDYQAPADREPDDGLADDALADKPAPKFDKDLVDRRPVNGLLLNASAAVMKLDVPPVKPDSEMDFLVLHPSYAAAVDAARAKHPDMTILPSVNMIDGKAKQFDDGLYAALEQAYFQNMLSDQLHGHIDLVRRMYDTVGKNSVAAPYIAAALELAGVKVEPANGGAKTRLLTAFIEDEARSKPIGFYTWTKELQVCFRFHRFLQHEFSATELEAPMALRAALLKDPSLLTDYHKILRFYSQLTNQAICLSIMDLPAPEEKGITLAAIAKNKKVTHETVAFFPASTSRETVLFDKLFPNGLAVSVNLMKELVRRIKSGEVDLQPKEGSGWYDYQVYALETLLMPEKSEEHGKLLLTKTYKKRMLDAFQALITKHRETHVRQVAISEGSLSASPSNPPPLKVKPRLRVEPNPSYYLRTARAYAFLNDFLNVSVGKSFLQALHGLRPDGPRELDLYNELHFQRDLFYGLYLISAEDLGLKPCLAADEPVKVEDCYRLANDWLAKAFQDRDLAQDTRVAVPIFIDGNSDSTRLWLNLGVRMASLDAEYARPPHVKSKQEREWRQVKDEEMEPSQYLIAVDEFAEATVPGQHVPTREGLGKVCDQKRTKERILAEIEGGKGN
jgi:hypothetical protein